MRSFLFSGSAFLLATAASSSSHVPERKVLQEIERCNEYELAACHHLYGSGKGGSDNSYCGSLPAKDYGETALTSFRSLCEYGKWEPRTARHFELLADNRLLAAIDGRNFEYVFGRLPHEVKEKVGDGVRKNLLEVAVTKGWGCQAWAQLSDNDGKSVFGAEAWVFDKVYDACLLLAKIPEGAKSPHTAAEEIVSDSAVEAGDSDVDGYVGEIEEDFEAEIEAQFGHYKPGHPQRRLGIFGRRSCNCRGFDCHSKQLSTSLQKFCQANPAAEKCRAIDTTDVNYDPSACLIDATHGVCVESAFIRDKCFSRANIVLPTRRKVLGPTTTDVKLFLAEQGTSFWDFAGKVGFSDWDDSETYGPRALAVTPEVAGPFACRAVLELAGTSAEQIKNIDAFFYDPKEHKCYFFLERELRGAVNFSSQERRRRFLADDQASTVEGTNGEDGVTGPSAAPAAWWFGRARYEIGTPF